MNLGLTLDPDVQRSNRRLTDVRDRTLYFIAQINNRRVILELEKLRTLEDEYEDSSKSIFESFRQDVNFTPRQCKFGIFPLKVVRMRGESLSKSVINVLFVIVPTTAVETERNMYLAFTPSFKTILSIQDSCVIIISEEPELTYRSMIRHLGTSEANFNRYERLFFFTYEGVEFTESMFLDQRLTVLGTKLILFQTVKRLLNVLQINQFVLINSSANLKVPLPDDAILGSTLTEDVAGQLLVRLMSRSGESSKKSTPSSTPDDSNEHLPKRQFEASKPSTNNENVTTKEEFPETSGGSDLRSNNIPNDGIAGVEAVDAILLVGTNPRFEAPTLIARIRKSFLYSDVQVGVIGAETELTYEYDYLGASAKAIDDILSGKGDFAKTLNSAAMPLIIVGAQALKGESGAVLLGKLQQLAEKLGNGKEVKVLNVLQRWAGQAGAQDVGYKAGTSSIRKTPIKFLYLLGADEGEVTKANLDPSAFFVYQGHYGDAGADVVLPGAAYTEKEGTYVNTEGRSQRAYPAVSPPGDAREDWMILRAVSEVAGKALPYNDLKEIRQRLNEIAPHLLRYRDLEPSPFVKQALQLAQISGPIDVDVSPALRELSDYYQTNVISRNSRSMAQARKAAIENKTNPYAEEQIHARL